MLVRGSRTYESAVGAGIPHVAASVALLVEVAGALGGIGKDLIAGLPVVADTPGSAANGRRPPVRNAGSGLVEVGIGPEYQSLCLDAAVEAGGIGNNSRSSGQEEKGNDRVLHFGGNVGRPWRWVDRSE